MKEQVTRRGFVKLAAAGSAALSWLRGRAPMGFASESEQPALLGGKPIHTGRWPRWPEWREAWEPDILKILRSGRWYRGSGGGKVPEFEAGYADLLGAKRCLATASGTTALITSLHAIGVDAGDEVIVSPFSIAAPSLAQTAGRSKQRTPLLNLPSRTHCRRSTVLRHRAVDTLRV